MVDLSSHFDVLGRRGRTMARVQVELTPQMYQPDPVPKHHWLYAAFTAFVRLRAHLANANHRTPGLFCDVGTSSGLDAIGAWEALMPERLLLTDIVDGVLPIARKNVIRNCLQLKPKHLLIRSGDLATPIVDSGVQVDVAYANLPVLPVEKSDLAIARNGVEAASFYAAARHRNAPEMVRKRLQELYWSFLNTIRPCLTADGVVMCAFGGRQYFEPIVSLFSMCGFDASLAYYGIKPQEQAKECLPIYAASEDDHETFEFFAFDEIEQVDFESRYRDCNEFTMMQRTEAHDRWLAEISPHSKSAKEALALANEGTRIGHVVYMVLGTPRKG